MGAPETVPAGKADTNRSNGVLVRGQFAAHVGDDVNDVGIAFDRHQLVDFDAANRGDPADVVAAQVDQHDVLGALFGVGEQIGFELALFFRRGAAAACAGDGAELDVSPVEPDHRFGRGADHAKILQLQIEHVGRRIDETQGAIDFERVVLSFRFRVFG